MSAQTVLRDGPPPAGRRRPPDRDASGESRGGAGDAPVTPRAGGPVRGRRVRHWPIGTRPRHGAARRRRAPPPAHPSSSTSLHSYASSPGPLSDAGAPPRGPSSRYRGRPPLSPAPPRLTSLSRPAGPSPPLSPPRRPRPAPTPPRGPGPARPVGSLATSFPRRPSVPQAPRTPARLADTNEVQGLRRKSLQSAHPGRPSLSTRLVRLVRPVDLLAPGPLDPTTGRGRWEWCEPLKST